MKKITELIYSCTNRMFNYVRNGRDLGDLIGYLRMYEENAIKKYGGENKGLCFKFGTNDTLCTTIDDIERDLNLPSAHSNHILLIEKMESTFGLNPNEQLEVYYS